MRFLSQILFVRLSIVAALVVALGSVGLAHRVAPVVDAEMLAFLEVGGTFADICNDTQDNAHAAVVCEACQFSGATALPVIGGVACDMGLGRVVAASWPVSCSAV